MAIVYSLLVIWGLVAVGYGIQACFYCPKMGNRIPFTIDNFTFGVCIGIAAPIISLVFLVKDFIKKLKKVVD